MHKIAELTDQLEKSKAQVKKDEMTLKVKVEEKSKIEKKLNSTQAKLNQTEAEEKSIKKELDTDKHKLEALEYK